MRAHFIVLALSACVGAGCTQPMADTAVHDPQSSYVSTNGPATGAPADHAFVDPSRNELNHTGAGSQNGGSGAPSGATGNSASQ
jgi:hypothetical protein